MITIKFSNHSQVDHINHILETEMSCEWKIVYPLCPSTAFTTSKQYSLLSSCFSTSQLASRQFTRTNFLFLRNRWRKGTHLSLNLTIILRKRHLSRSFNEFRAHVQWFVDLLTLLKQMMVSTQLIRTLFYLTSAKSDDDVDEPSSPTFVAHAKASFTCTYFEAL